MIGEYKSDKPFFVEFLKREYYVRVQDGSYTVIEPNAAGGGLYRGPIKEVFRGKEDFGSALKKNPPLIRNILTRHNMKS